jgi:hypothetical protein
VQYAAHTGVPPFREEQIGVSPPLAAQQSNGESHALPIGTQVLGQNPIGAHALRVLFDNAAQHPDSQSLSVVHTAAHTLGSLVFVKSVEQIPEQQSADVEHTLPEAVQVGTVLPLSSSVIGVVSPPLSLDGARLPLSLAGAVFPLSLTVGNILPLSFT